MVDFICCDDLACDCVDDMVTVKQLVEENEYRFCPYCGYRLSSLD